MLMNSRLYILIIGIVFQLISSTITGQTYIMGTWGGPISTCTGIIENPGGFGFYEDGLVCLKESVKK